MRSHRHRSAIVAAATAVWLVGLRVAALAQGYPGGGNSPSPTVGGEKFFPDEDLGRTGTDIVRIVLIALAILLIGLALHRLTRRAARDT